MSTSFDGRAIRSFMRRHQRVPAGEHLRVAVARAEQLDALLDALGDLVVERCRDHDFASSIARQTRSGVAGIWMSVTPRCESASTTALITAGAAAIVPVSPTPLTPNGFVGLGLSVRSSSYDGSSAADGHEVRDEVRRLQVAVLVVDALLVERRRDALRDPAVHLPVDDQRVDDRADVVDRDVADEPRVARLGVDLDDRRVGAARPREVRRVVGRRRLEARLHPVGEVVRRERGPGGRLHGHLLVGRALDAEGAVRVLEVVGRDLELVRDDLARLLDRSSRPRSSAATPPTGRLRLPYVSSPSARWTCRRAAPRPRRCRSRAGRRRSATTPSRGPGRAARCR